jgi:hypothetical protein
VQYHEHKKAEAQKAQRRKNFVDRYERLLDFDIQRSIGGILDVVSVINDMRWQEQEAKYNAQKDYAVIEGLQRIKEKINSESDYDRRRRQKQIGDLRHAATTIESLYRRLDEPQE